MNRKLFWNSVLVLAAVGAGIALSLKPWQVYDEQRQMAAQATKEMRKAEKNREELTREKARYESPHGKEQLARERGYLRPGETLVEGD